jgi:hypothetical protein
LRDQLQDFLFGAHEFRAFFHTPTPAPEWQFSTFGLAKFMRLNAGAFCAQTAKPIGQNTFKAMVISALAVAICVLKHHPTALQDRERPAC